MRSLTMHGQQAVQDIANRYGVSTDCVATLLDAVANGGGTMAQFNHWEVGGSGQWMSGGMTMVGDMFNHSLKAKVDGICCELSNLLSQQPFQPLPPPVQHNNWGSQQQQQGGGGYQQQSGGYPGSSFGSPVSLFVSGSGNWWPNDLGSPSSSGSQNNVRYAFFPSTRRLAVDINGVVSVYDTLDHQINGVSQQQSGDSSVTFTSQYGIVTVRSLPIISGPDSNNNSNNWQNNPPIQPTAAPQNNNYSSPASNANEADIFAKIERLAQLKQSGILTEDEFISKKSELLSRL